MAQIRVIILQIDSGYWRQATVGMVEEVSDVCLCGGEGYVCVCVCVRRWSRGWEEVGLKETTGTALGSVACSLPLGSKLDQRRKIHALPLQCRPLSLVGIGTVNHFGNSFQLIKMLPDRDC